MRPHWELFAFGVLGLGLLAIGVASVVVAWIKDRQRWRAVQPYYGRPYDASSPRPNIRRVR